MIFFLVIVLIALLFGFVFAKLDTLTKVNKILKDEVVEMQKNIENINNKK